MSVEGTFYSTATDRQRKTSLTDGETKSQGEAVYGDIEYKNIRRMFATARACQDSRYSMSSLSSPALLFTLLCLLQFLLCEEIQPFSMSPVVWVDVANSADLSVIHLWGRRAHCLSWGK